jgi:transcriptional regulator with XRE-family HTH domain
MLHTETWVATSGLTRTEVARRAGLARSTMLRVDNGTVSPTVATLRELAIACGLDVEITTRTLSDPAAAEAARSMLENGYVVTDPVATAQWVERLTRMAGNEPVDIVRAAGVASTLRARRGAHYFKGKVPMLRVASAGDATDLDWAISGGPPLGAAGTTVLWSADADLAARFLGEAMSITSEPREADVIVAPSHPGIYVDSWMDTLVRYVAPIQMLLDAFGLEESLAQAAMVEARSW